MGVLVLLVALASLAATGWSVARALRLDGALEHVLGAFVVAACWLVAVCLALSAVERLTRWPLLAALVLGAAMAVALARGRAAPWPAGERERLGDALRQAAADPIVVVLAVVVALELAYVAIFSFAIPQADWDALLYHLPRAAAWAQDAGIGWIEGVSDPRLNGFAPHAEIGMTATLVLEGSDRFVGLVQLVSLVVGGAAVALLALRLGFAPRGAAFGALVWMTLPVVAVQAPTALNDLALAAPLVAATALAAGRGAGARSLAGAATALAFGVKLTAFLVAPLAALVLAVLLPRRRAAAALAACAAGALVGSYWYVVARARTGSFDGGVAEWQNQAPERDLGATLERMESFAVSFLDASGVARGDRWLFPLLGLALVAAAGMRARRGVPARHLAIAGAVVACAPLAVYAARVALGHERRVDDLSLSLVDPMVSWYGLAFVLLWPAAAFAVWRGASERVARAAALAALAAPALFVVVFAVAVVEDGIRGRFFMLPVALAAATFGAVLRWRSVAWAATSLAALTAVLSFVHWDHRPMGVRLIAPRVHPALWTAPRWQALAANVAPENASLFRALQERLPSRHVTVAAAIGPDEYLYPLHDARLRRRVVYVASGKPVPDEAAWLVVGPGGRPLVCEDDWETTDAPADGWRILRRVRAGGAGCRAALSA